MPEAIFIFFVAIAVISVTAILFGGWAVVTLLRVVFRGFAAIFGDSSPRSLEMRNRSEKICPHYGCGAGNPVAAQFCRRCGRQLPPGKQRAQMKRVAMW